MAERIQSRILHRGDGVAVAEIGRICVTIWRDGVTPSRFEKQRAGLEQVVRNQPDGAGFLCVIEPTAKPPNDELRRASTEMVDSHGTRLKCVAVVIEGEGFRAAVTRSVVSGMALLFSRRMPGKTFSSVADALRWMAPFLSLHPIVVPRVGMLVEEVRRGLDPLE